MKHLVTLLLALLLATHAQAGVVFEVETTLRKSPEKTQTVTISVQDGFVRIPVLENEEERFVHIWRKTATGTNQLMYLDPRGHYDSSKKEINRKYHGTYSVVDRNWLREAQQRDAADERDRAERLKQLPPETRKAILDAEARQGKPTKTKLTTTRFREDHTVNGYPCSKYSIFINGQRVRTLWLTNWDNLKAQGAGQALSDVEDFVGLVRESYPELVPLFSTPYFPLDATGFQSGCPVKVLEYEGSQVVRKTILKSVRNEFLNPGDFEPPRGYRLVGPGSFLER